MIESKLYELKLGLILEPSSRAIGNSFWYGDGSKILFGDLTEVLVTGSYSDDFPTLLMLDDGTYLTFDDNSEVNYA